MNRTAIGVSPAIPFSGKGGSAVPNKDECLQSVVNKKPAYNADSGYWEHEDKIGKVKKTPLNGNVYNFDGTDDHVKITGNTLVDKNADFRIELDFIRIDCGWRWWFK